MYNVFPAYLPKNAAPSGCIFISISDCIILVNAFLNLFQPPLYVIRSNMIYFIRFRQGSASHTENMENEYHE